MPVEQTIILLPCHSFEDFPTHFRGSDADSVLANWTTAGHPTLVFSTGKLPRYRSADNPGEMNAETLFLIPTVSKSLLTPEFTDQSKILLVLTGHTNRDELISSILDILKFPDLTQHPCLNLVQDFYALGFAFLQVQLMTRQLRGSSNLDESRFEDCLVAAANAWNSGDPNLTRSELTKCFDLLSAEKNSYYPVQPDLIDLVLTAPTTIGASFRKDLESHEHPRNVLITGSLCRELEASAPQNFERLKALIAAEKVCLVGSLEHELAEPMLSAEVGVNQIRLASNSLKELFNVESKIHARRRFGLGPLTPRLLEQANFFGAVHCTLDAGSFPTASTNNIRWESDDGTSILALAQTPVDANEGATFLRLGISIGRSLDSAHVATVVFAHWPAKTHFCFKDLLIIRSYSSLFGRFRTLLDYFDGIYDPGYGENFSAHDYRGEYLKCSLDRGESDPVSRIIDYWNRFYQHNALKAVLVLHAVGEIHDHATLQTWLERLNHLQSRIELATEQVDSTIDEDLEQIAMDLRAESEATSQIVVNTTSFPREVLVKSLSQNCYIKAADNPIHFADSTDEMTEWAIEVPPMSATRLPNGEGSVADLVKEPGIVEGHKLRNEFFEVEIDPDTGGIFGINKYDRRNSLLSQQLALRIPATNKVAQQPLMPARYSRMSCSEIQSRCPTRLSGEITTTGKLLDKSNGQEIIVATFEQKVRVARRIPVIEVCVTLNPRVELTPSTNHYFCSRIAWKHESADLTRSDQEASVPVIEDRFEAPNFIEIQEALDSIVLLTGGIPYHRRSSRRMLDTLLIVAGETRRQFRFGIGLNAGFPIQSAINFMTPPIVYQSDHATGWFFHFNSKNIVVTSWEPILDAKRGCEGVSIRIRETQKRAGQLKIRCPRVLSSARRVNFLGEHLQEIEVEGNLATLRFQAAEYFQIQLNWKS